MGETNKYGKKSCRLIVQDDNLPTLKLMNFISGFIQLHTLHSTPKLMVFLERGIFEIKEQKLFEKLK